MQIDFQTIFPIASLNPYQHRWTIKARCTFKSEIRHWQKEGKGSGQLFHVDLLDESGEIRATFFNDAVDKFFPIFKVDNVLTHSHSLSLILILIFIFILSLISSSDQKQFLFFFLTLDLLHLERNSSIC
jgi:hypothetical protein